MLIKSFLINLHQNILTTFIMRRLQKVLKTILFPSAEEMKWSQKGEIDIQYSTKGNVKFENNYHTRKKWKQNYLETNRLKKKWTNIKFKNMNNRKIMHKYKEMLRNIKWKNPKWNKIRKWKELIIKIRSSSKWALIRNYFNLLGIILLIIMVHE